MLVKQLLCLFFLTLSAGILLSQPAACLCTSQTSFDDWITVPECQSLCQGYYSECTAPFCGESPTFIAEQPTTATSDSAIYPQTGPAELKGHVHLIQGNRQLFADQLVFHSNSKEGGLKSAVATGNVKMLEPGVRIDATKATLNTLEDTKVAQQACFRYYPRHAHGSSETLIVCGKNRMELIKATYTTCNPYQNTWHLASRQVHLNKETGRGQAKHAILYVKEVPVFYFPYIDFPIDDRRETGFLYPSPAITNNSGFELSTPFYWNIAPNYDALLTPTLFTKRGVEARGLFRYLFPNSNGEFEGAILPNDRAYKAFQKKHLHDHPMMASNDRRVTGLKGGATRDAVRLRHTTHFNSHWVNNIFYHRVSDDNYFQDFGTTLSSASITQQLQLAELLYQDHQWNNMLRFQQYQTLHPFFGPITTDIYKRLPQFTFSHQNTDLPCQLQWGIEGDITHFDHADKNVFTTGNRFEARPSLQLPIMTPGWFITPRIQCDLLTEDLEFNRFYTFDARDINAVPIPHHQRTKHPSRIMPMLDVDSGLIFERSAQIANCSYIQTLEPRAYYLYVPYRNQKNLPVFDSSFIPFDFNQLYRDNRFSGFDRISDANQLTLGLTQRFLSPQTGRERINLTFGQIYYFQDRKVYINKREDHLRHQPFSALVGRLYSRLDDAWSVYTEVEWDPKRKQASKRSANLQYSPDPLDVLNLRYLFIQQNPNIINPLTLRPETLNQTDISFAWRLTEQWRVLGRWHYDIIRHRSNDILAGIEQQGCCTAIRFAISRFLPPYDPQQPGSQKRDTRFQLQIVFKGLAGVGTKIQPVLSEKIPGYRWRGDSF